MIEFEGVLAVLNRPTEDGRVLRDPGEQLTRPLPLPLVRGVTGEEWGVLGPISQVWIEGDLLRYSGQVHEDDPAVPLIRSGELVGMLDADNIVDQLFDGAVEFTGWRVVGATLMPASGKGWREVCMTLKEEHTVSTFPQDPSGAHEVAPPAEADETNEVEPAAGHDEPHPSSDESV